RAGETFAAEWLHANDGADHVAIHVEVADARAFDDARDRGVDPAVNAERESVAEVVDGVDQRIDFAPAKRHHMQHRAENFAREAAEPVEHDKRRRDERAVRAMRRKLDAIAAKSRSADRFDV